MAVTACTYATGYACVSCGQPAHPHCYLLPDNQGRGFPACEACVRAPDIFAVLRRIPSDAQLVRKAPRIVFGGVPGVARFTVRGALDEAP